MNQKIKFLSGVAIVGLILAALVLAGCGTWSHSRGASLPFGPDRLSGGGERFIGSGRVMSREFDLRGFDRVEISNAFRVDIVQARSYGVTVRIDDNLAPHLRVEKQGDTLIIGLKPLRGFNIGRSTQEAEVRLPELRGVQASGASDASMIGFSGGREFEAELSGASTLEGEIEAGHLRLELSGASRGRLRGSAESIYIHASGASNLDLENLPVTDAEIELSGASEAQVVINGNLDLEASGASRLLFEGNPVLGRIELSGASSIKRR